MSERSMRSRGEVRHRSRERRGTRSSSSRSSRRSKDSTPGRAARPRRQSASRNGNVLRRTASEPILWQSTLQWEEGRAEIHATGKMRKKEILLWRPQTLSDLFERSNTIPLPPRTPLHAAAMPKPEKPECDKILVNVTVEGSTGPIRLIMRKADTVGDLIKLTIDNYTKEGRHPALDSDTNLFELHLSNFSMESLKRSDKVGELGSRTFFLRQENRWDSEPALFKSPTGPLFFSVVMRRMKKIGRRTRKFWNIVACI